MGRGRGIGRGAILSLLLLLFLSLSPPFITNLPSSLSLFTFRPSIPLFSCPSHPHPPHCLRGLLYCKAASHSHHCLTHNSRSGVKVLHYHFHGVAASFSKVADITLRDDHEEKKEKEEQLRKN